MSTVTGWRAFWKQAIEAAGSVKFDSTSRFRVRFRQNIAEERGVSWHQDWEGPHRRGPAPGGIDDGCCTPKSDRLMSDADAAGVLPRPMSSWPIVLRDCDTADFNRCEGNSPSWR